MTPAFIEELYKARKEKNITLKDISASTNINIHFLEALEQGNFDVLPQPYIRAFLRKYASIVGINADSVIKQYNEFINPLQQTEPKNEKKFPDERRVSLGSIPVHKFTFIGIGIVVFIIIFYFIIRSSDVDPVVERPFNDVVRELEEEAEEFLASPTDPLTILPVQPDSISVTISTIDTVWVTITIDYVEQQEYIFPPNVRRQWKAANELLLTVGNAGGIALYVDDEEYGILGDPGQVLRNLRITKDGLQR